MCCVAPPPTLLFHDFSASVLWFMQSGCFARCPEAYALSLRSFHLPEARPRAPLLLRPPTSLASVRWSSRAVWFRVLLALSLLVREGARQIVAVSRYCGAHLETFGPSVALCYFWLTKLWLCPTRLGSTDLQGRRNHPDYEVTTGLGLECKRKSIQTKPPRMPLWHRDLQKPMA